MVGLGAWGWGMAHIPLLIRGPGRIETPFKDILQFVLEVIITVMVTKKASVEKGSGGKFWGNMALAGC